MSVACDVIHSYLCVEAETDREIQAEEAKDGDRPTDTLPWNQGVILMHQENLDCVHLS